MEKLNINQWAEEDRPREKMERLGAEALSDAELLAILIGSGSSQEDAVSLMKRILAQCDNNLNSLGKMSLSDLCRFKGIGSAKAITIMAASELGKRRQLQAPEVRKELNSATRIYNYMHSKLADKDTEEFWVVYMNHRYALLKSECVARGGITEVAVDVRIIVRNALLANATIIAVCHNHPSGSIHPSRQDDNITQQINEACRLMRLHLSDHVIVTDGAYYSYREEGRL